MKYRNIIQSVKPLVVLSEKPLIVLVKKPNTSAGKIDVNLDSHFFGVRISRRSRFFLEIGVKS